MDQPRFSRPFVAVIVIGGQAVLITGMVGTERVYSAVLWSFGCAMMLVLLYDALQEGVWRGQSTSKLVVKIKMCFWLCFALISWVVGLVVIL